MAKFQAEQKYLAVLAAAEPSRGIWARPSVVAHQDSAAAYAKAVQSSKLLDILSMLGSPSDLDCEPVSDADILAPIDAPESRGTDGVDRGSGARPPDPATPARDGQSTEGHPSVSVSLNHESFVDDKGRTWVCQSFVRYGRLVRACRNVPAMPCEIPEEREQRKLRAHNSFCGHVQPSVRNRLH